jgi:radical SAM superfamily enzyme YgiQ (UPF0313 family)
VTNLFGKKIRHVPVENVVRDIQSSGSRNFMFLDDNIIGHPKYAKELFRALKPLKIRWVGQASYSLLANDDELLDLAWESGCRVLFFGIESVGVDQMKSMRKTAKELDELELALKKIKKKGILIHASMIFGFDDDRIEVFDETVRFLIRNKVSTVSFNVLTPYPGTKVYEELKNAGRLTTTDWTYYDHNTVVFQPKNMSPWELQIGKVGARKKFYSYWSVFKRSLGNLNNLPIYLSINIGNRRQVKLEKRRIQRIRSFLFDQPSLVPNSLPAT